MVTTQAKIIETTEQRPAMSETAIADSVLEMLGQPDDFHRIQVRPVFGDRYRVNVYVRAGLGSYRIAHSYLVAVDGDGHITEANPPIARLY